MKIIKDTPLAEITLRRYEKPHNISKRDAVKKLCLSLGLLQPGDSRDVIVDIFHVLLQSKSNKDGLGSEKIKEKVIELRKHKKLALLGIASSNIRRQLKRLRDLFLVDKIKNKYRIAEASSVMDIFEEKIEKYLLPSIISRAKDYIKEVDGEFSK